MILFQLNYFCLIGSRKHSFQCTKEMNLCFLFLQTGFVFRRFGKLFSLLMYYKIEFRGNL